jgi:transposase
MLWTPEEDLLLKKMLEEGSCYADLEPLFNRTVQTLRNRAHKLGVSRHIWNIYLPEEVQKQIIDFYQSGLVLTDIEKILGLSYHRVQWCVKKHGLLIDRSRAGKKSSQAQKRSITKEEQKIVDALWEKGVSIEKIAIEIDCCRSTLSKFIKENQYQRKMKRKGKKCLTEEQVSELISDFYGIQNRCFLGKKYKTSWFVLRRILKEAGVDTAAVGKIKAGKYPVSGACVDEKQY